MVASGNHHMEMTELSLRKKALAAGPLTLEDAIRELRENACVRSVKEILASAYGLRDADPATLAEAVCRSLRAVTPDMSEESVAKKVRNWVNGKSASISKDSAIQLAFALHLPLSEAEALIMRLSGERLHWRDPAELVFGFALNTGRSYQEARSLYQALEQKGCFELLDTDETVMTEALEYDLTRIASPEALEAYLLSHRGQLGKLHNTARQTMDELMEVLKEPGKHDLMDDETVPVKEIVLKNLYSDIIPRTRTAAERNGTEKQVLSALQKSIRAGWPEETVFSRMKQKKTDVTRKTLILLFLATDGGESVYADWSIREESREVIFEDRLERLCVMLTDCGFAPLDPRAPFDWMVLYCLCDEENLIADERMRRFLAAIFEDEAE